MTEPLSELKPMFDNFVSALGDRFRQQYPQGSIVSDLVQIHGDQYVVKVSISVAGNILVACLAADANLTLAEQRATEQALAILGVTSIAVVNDAVSANVVTSIASEANQNNLIVSDINDPVQSLSPQSIASSKNEAIEPANSKVQRLPDLPADMTAVQSADPIEPPIITEIAVIDIPEISTSEVTEYPVEFYDQPTVPEPDEDIISTFNNGKMAVADSIELPIPEESVPTVAVVEPIVVEPVVKSNRTKKAAVIPEPAPENIPEPLPPAKMEVPWDDQITPVAEPPLSVTDMIPLINMELKRLGWSKERGRDYMVSLYNKRASALLSDEELFGLLQHLKAEQIV
jgi:hypothetical protein